MGKANQPGKGLPKETILVVDDDESVRRALLWTLNVDYRVLEAASRLEANTLLQHEKIDVVVSDLHLPPHIEDISEGLAIIEAARDRDPPAQVMARLKEMQGDFHGSELKTGSCERTI